MEETLDNKVILVTGGTGSFGGEVTKRLLKENVAEIKIFSRDETKQENMKRELDDNRLKFFIGDVRDIESVRMACKNVDYIFHAAAMKYVSSCDLYPEQAVKTNVLGSHNVYTAAIENHVKKIISLSTDKAVYPISVMGMTKALEEKDSLYFSKNAFNSTIFCTVRYGNVMGSRGSILNLFYEKAKNHKILPLTDENMERFFLTLKESTELVLYALKNGEQGDLFIKKAPSCKILDLAKAVIEVTNSNSAISIVGNRSGDKLSEYLATSEEMNNAIDLGSYFRINSLKSLTDQANFYRHPEKDLSYNTKIAEHLTKDNLVSKIRGIIQDKNE